MEVCQTEDHKLPGASVGCDEKSAPSPSNTVGNAVSNIENSDVNGGKKGSSSDSEIVCGSASSQESEHVLTEPVTVSDSERLEVDVTEELQESPVCENSSPIEIDDNAEGMVIGDCDPSEGEGVVESELDCEDAVDNSVKDTLVDKPSDEFDLEEPTECEGLNEDSNSVQKTLNDGDEDIPTETILDNIQKVLNEDGNSSEYPVASAPKSGNSDCEQREQIERESGCESSTAHVLDGDGTGKKEDLTDKDCLLNTGDSEIKTSTSLTISETGDAEEITTSVSVLDTGDSAVESSTSHTELDIGDSKMHNSVQQTAGDTEETEMPAPSVVDIGNSKVVEMSAAPSVFAAGDSGDVENSAVSISGTSNSQEVEMSAASTVLDTGDTEDVEMAAVTSVLDTGKPEEVDMSPAHTVLDTGDTAEVEMSAATSGLDTVDSEEVEMSAVPSVLDTGDSDSAEKIESPCAQSKDVDKLDEGDKMDNETKDSGSEEINDNSSEATANLNKNRSEKRDEELANNVMEVSEGTEGESENRIEFESVQIESESNVQCDEDSQNMECEISNADSSKEPSDLLDKNNQKEDSKAENENTAKASPSPKVNSIEKARQNDAVSSAQENDLLVEDISVDTQVVSPKINLSNSDEKKNATSDKEADSDLINNKEVIIQKDTDSVLINNEEPITEKDTDSDMINSEEAIAVKDTDSDIINNEAGNIEKDADLNVINTEEEEKLLSDETEIMDEVNSGKESQELPNVDLEKGENKNPSVGNDESDSTAARNDAQGDEENTDKNETVVDDVSEVEEIEKSEELGKDSGEHSRDMQDNVEFVQIDSDKDESSQHSIDRLSDENTQSADEKDPIAISNEENKDDSVAEPEDNEQAMEVDDAVDLDSNTGSADSKTVDTVDDSVDLSEICETVLEESSTSVPKPVDSANNAVDILEIIETESQKNIEKTPKNKYFRVGVIVDGKKAKPANSTSQKKANSNNLVEDEEICIIPDTVPRVISISGNKESKGKAESVKGRRASKPYEVTEKSKEKSPEVPKDGKDVTETRRTPGRPQRQAAKRAESQIKEIADEERQETEELIRGIRMCDGCFKLRNWVTSLKFQENGVETVKYFCSSECSTNFKRSARGKPNDVDGSSNSEVVRRIARKCAQCSSLITGDEKNLSWETMDYCNEDCLGRYQRVLGSQCANCRGTVVAPSLGKYCVRFGYDVKQFCCSTCLEEFKKGLKVCSYCQKDISGGAEGFLAPVGDKGQFKDFCTQSCMEKYDQMSNNHAPPVVVQECAVCNNEKVVAMEVLHKKRVNKFCSEPCFAAFRFVNGMVSEQCYMCKKYFDKKEVDNFAVYSDDVVHCFCSKTCMNVYILANRKIVPCHWCKVKKYNFDMIKRIYNTGQLLLVCSLNCLSLYQYGAAVSSKRIKCDMCGTMSSPQYNLNMSDNSLRNFCSYVCVMKFQEQFTNALRVDSSPFPTGGPKRYINPRRSLAVQQNETQRENVPGSKNNNNTTLPVISSVQSLANDDSSIQSNVGITTRSAAALKQVNNNIPQNAVHSPKVVRQIIVRPPAPKAMRNKAVTCRPTTHTKGTHCRPIVSTKETQTETTPSENQPVIIPVPVPIYVPAPMCMYSSAFPVPVPFPLPVPVPIFVPTTRNSAKGIMKEIKRIQEKIPIDPFEAELLMMAEIVAGEKKDVNSDSDSDAGDNNADVGNGTGEVEEEPVAASGGTTTEGTFTPENVDASNTFGDDMLQIALKMATELEEPADLEAALTPSTITPQSASNAEHTNSESEDDPEPVQPVQEVRPQRGRKRAVRTTRSSTSNTAAAATTKRRRVSVTAEPLLLPPPEPTQPSPAVEQEKPDANMCLKYTLGVNAWKRWVLTKNAELEKAAASNRKLKLFKTEILQQTADELNYSLCLFVKEVRKPNGQEYAPDTIYYLCLGIQQYLFESGRIDNIFTDPYYEKFTECLDEVAKKFSTLYNDSQYIVTRVEEEHLWESKQLGAHSPHVLLSTLMFFNTKHFNLTTVEEHMQLSFSHIMKHWKRNPNQSGTNKSGPGSNRNVLLRFYPPQSAVDANPKKKKVYEQQENEENPLRCPVKLYEFYLSKCPESVKTRNDVFYLLPERSCVPDSPVWYSTMALGKEPLMKMLHRVKMVKEINQALLKS